MIKDLERLRCNVFWGGENGSGENKGMAWVKWDRVCLALEKRGLGCKWLWRYGEESELWRRVVGDKFGEGASK